MKFADTINTFVGVMRPGVGDVRPANPPEIPTPVTSPMRKPLLRGVAERSSHGSGWRRSASTRRDL